MILLLGGTGETARLAGALAGAGWRVLVSMATGAPLEIGNDPRVERRRGRLDAEGMAALARQRGVRAIVDATHPYAVEAHATALSAARELGVPCLRWEREASDLTGMTGVAAADNHSNVNYKDHYHSSADGVDVVVAATHEEAARLAFEPGLPVLLLIGSRNVAPYGREAAARGVPVAARVLPMAESLEACRRAGIPADRVVAARGPFSVEDNLVLIRRFGAGAIVTKDGGREGGMPEKLEAARRAGRRAVVVRRPPPAFGASAVATVEALLLALKTA